MPRPSLTPAEHRIVDGYGGWINFMHSFGLKEYNMEDVEEATSIVREMAQRGN